MRVKYIILVIILVIGVIALIPPKDDSDSEGGSVDGDATADVDKKYIIRIYPGNWYIPGMSVSNVSKPVENMGIVAREFEKLYPDTKIEFVNVPVIREWLVTQLSSGLAPDILHVNVEDVWQDTHKGWYIALDSFLEKPNPFIEAGQPGSVQWWDLFKYQAITRGKAAPDKKMYCIPYDMIETGIFYNKDIFKELGLSVPEDWAEFLDIQKKLRDAGYIPFIGLLDWMADWGVDLIFDQFYYPILDGIDLNKDPIREQYLMGYLDWDEISFLHGKGYFTKTDKRYVELWRTLKEWRGYWNSDLASSTDVWRMFVSRKGAMLWNSSMLVDRLMKDPDIDFEWGVFYPPPIPKSYSKYCDGHEVCVIGGPATQLAVTNSSISDTDDPETSERLKRCIAFLQYLTVPENADLVVNETVILMPNIKGVEPHEPLKPFHEFLQRRYTTTKLHFTFDLKFNEIMLRMLDLYLNDGISEDEFLDWIEKNMSAAIDRVIKRKDIDFAGFEKKWEALAPIREKYEDLPDENQ